MRTALVLVTLITLLVSWSGCSSSPQASNAGSASVTGTIFFRERIMLPQDSTAEALLVDDTIGEGRGGLIARQLIDNASASSVPFELRYDPARIDQNHRYVVKGRIYVGGRIWFLSETEHPVITLGNSSHTDVLVVRKR